MKAGKFIVILAIMVLVCRAGFSQSRDEAVFPPEKADAAKLVELYPNPATEYLNVRFETAFAKKIKLTLHNIIGNNIDVEAEVMDEHELQLKVRDLPSGFYLLSFRDPDSGFKSTYKFLKR